MSIMDLMGGAPAPGGPPPPGPPMGPPGMPPAGGMPEEIDVEEEGEPEPGGGPLEILRTAIDSLQDYIAADHDEEDKAEGTKALATLQRILARNQKQDAMGGDAARQMRRALSG